MEEVLVRLKALEDANVELNFRKRKAAGSVGQETRRRGSNPSDASGGRPAGHEHDGPLAKVLAPDKSLCGSSRATFVRFPAAFRGPRGVDRLSRSRCGRRFAGQPMVLRPGE